MALVKGQQVAGFVPFGEHDDRGVREPDLQVAVTGDRLARVTDIAADKVAA